MTTTKRAKTGPAATPAPRADRSDPKTRETKTLSIGLAQRDVRSRESSGADAHVARLPATVKPTGTTSQTKLPAGVQILTPNIVSVAHWSRLLNGALYAAQPRVDWATLLRRSFAVDVLECPACRGRLRVLGSVTEPQTVRDALSSLGLPTTAPQAARARDPTELFGNSPTD